MLKALLYVFICAVFLPSCERSKHRSEVQQQLLKNHLVRYIDTCWNQQNLNKLNPIISDDFERHLNGISVASSTNELKAHMEVFFKGFPDLEIITNEINMNDEVVLLHWISIGSNTGIYGEMPPTGKKVKVSGLSHIYFNKEGQIYREDVYFNELELLQQLGYTLNSPVLK